MVLELKDSSDDKLSALWQAACIGYANETGKPLGDVALAGVQGPEDLSRHLDAEKDNFEGFRAKRRPLLHAMQAVIAPFEPGLVSSPLPSSRQLQRSWAQWYFSFKERKR
jgi:hypothetical protein